MYFAPLADFKLLDQAYHEAQAQGLSVQVGNVLGEDRFYNDEIDRHKLIKYGVLATEMETPALYLLARKYQRQALAILTVSNHLITGEETTAIERQTSFDDMIALAFAVVKGL
jgi:purine-nucleoside phosphorylase